MVLLLFGGSAWAHDLQPGDLVFHTSKSDQSAAIRVATGSAWTHVGLVLEEEGQLVVAEASAVVRTVALDEFLRRGEGGRYVAARPTVAVDQTVLADTVRSMLGRPYDPAFDWDDERLYCSELVVKAYAAAGLELGVLQPVSSFHIEDPALRDALRRRGIPLDRRVVSPASLLTDPRLQMLAVTQ